MYFSFGITLRNIGDSDCLKLLFHYKYTIKQTELNIISFKECAI